MDKLSKETKIELLIHIHSITRQEINILRQRQERIFEWTSQIFLIVIGALLVIDQSKIPIWYSQGGLGKALASITIIMIGFFSIHWQQRTKRYQQENSKVVNNVEELLHCFEEGFYDPNGKITLYPSRWKAAKNEEQARLWKRLFRTNYILATTILGLLAIAMILLSGS